MPNIPLGHTGRTIGENAYFSAILLLFFGLDLLAVNSIFDGDTGNLYYLGALCIAAVPIMALTKMLRRHDVDWFAIACFILAAIVSLHYIHISNNLAYTNDLWDLGTQGGGHMARIQYTASHWLNPYGYNGWQHQHPPLYYYIAGAVYWISEQTKISETWTAVRFLSWCIYLLFNVYNLLTLRKVLASGTAYRAAAALLLLWPLGLHAASKISSEPLWNALYAASFYYIVCWYQQKDQRKLFIALILAGIALAVRSNSIFLFIIIVILLAFDWWKGNFRLERCFLKQYAGVAAILLMCGLVNIGGIITGHTSINNHMGGQGEFKFYPKHLLTVDITYFLHRPFNNWDTNQTFLEYIARCSIFGEYTWKWPLYASMLQALLLTMLLYICVAWCLSRKIESHIIPFFFGLLVPLLFLMLYVSKHYLSLPFHDVRLVYPSLVCFIVFYMRSMEIYKARGLAFMQPAGALLALSFAALSVVFFWYNGR